MRTIFALGMLVLLLTLTGCSQAPGSLAQTPKPPTVDGKIEQSEYQYHYSNSTIKMDLYWTIVQDTIYVGLEAPAQGYMAWGLVTTTGMEDIVIGYVKDGKLTISDSFAIDHRAHKPDTSQGGKSDLLASAGSEAVREVSQSKMPFTAIEFSRKLNTGDRFDNPITEGTWKTYLAHSDSDDLVSNHGRDRRAAVQVNYFTGKSTN